jgi:hypothetical protein
MRSHWPSLTRNILSIIQRVTHRFNFEIGSSHYGGIVKIDISKLSASELDEFIAKVAERRYNMQPQLPGEPPQATQAIINPAWYVTPIKEGTLSIGHRRFGWLAFLTPRPEHVLLMSLLLQQSILQAPPNEPGVAAAAPSHNGGGGKLH